MESVAVDGRDLLIAPGVLLTSAIITLPARRWDVERQCWRVRHTKEAVAAIAYHGVDVSLLPEPSAYLYNATIVFTNQDRRIPYIFLQTSESPHDDLTCANLPQWKKFIPKDRGWQIKPSNANIQHILDHFPDTVWSRQAVGIRDRFLRMVEAREDDTPYSRPTRSDPEGHQVTLSTAMGLPVEVADYKFFTEPRIWQKEAFLACREAKVKAVWMDPGTGKTKVMIDVMAYQYQKGTIEAVVVICPATVKDVWAEEIQKHFPPWTGVDVHVDNAKTAQWIDKDTGKLRVLITNFEAWTSGKRADEFKRFVGKYRYTAIVDESTRIKNPMAVRTKAIIKATRLAKHRYALTGTPITQTPLDLYSQMYYLDLTILGFTSFYAFRNRYTILGGFNGKIVMGYVNLDELNKKIEPYVFRVSKDVLGLPPKEYLKRYVELSSEQKKLYTMLKDDLFAQHEKGSITVTQPMIQMLRFQQLVGGFLPLTPFPDESEDQYVSRIETAVPTQIDETPPKLAALQDLVENELAGERVVIFARFRPELALIAKRLRAEYGDDIVVEVHGGISKDDRTKARISFQDLSSSVRFIVMQQQVGGLGITLTKARYTIYYSNTYSLEDRIQTEDRTHRMTQEADRVVYFDLIAKVACDMKPITALRNKQKLSNLVTGDTWKEWL